MVHHQVEYEPPAPFSFHVLNDDLNVIEGKALKAYEASVKSRKDGAKEKDD